jgi:PAS domain S-box-containing protein
MKRHLSLQSPVDGVTFRLFADNLPTLCWIANGDGYIVWYNRMWHEYCGTTPEQMEGWGWQSVHDPVCLPVVLERWTSSIATGEPFEMTFPLRGADGLFRPFLTRIQPVRDAAGKVARWLGVNTEISEQRAVEEALREASVRNEALAAEHAVILGQLAEGVIVTDCDGKTVFINEAAKRLHGVDQLGVRLDEYSNAYHLLTQDGRPYPPRELPLARAVLDGKTITDALWRIRRPDGSEVLVIGSARPVHRADGGLVGAVLTMRDDTERRAAEQALLDLTATLETRVEERTRERDRTWRNSQDLLLVVDPNGVFQAANPAWTRILGWPPDEIVGCSYLKFIHPDDRASSRDAFVEAMTNGLPRYENRFRHKDGSYRWVSWVAAPEEDLIHASGRDITAERASAEALAQAEEQLRQSQKMEAVGQLTGGIAHDFNNLLQGISGSLELIRTRAAQGRTAELGRYIETAMGSANRAAALTHRLLAFSRRQTLDPKPTDLNRLVGGMEELFHRTVGPGIQVETSFAAEPWPTLCDPHQLENALLNLVLNARDAMPDGGQLLIETANTALLDRRGAPRDWPPRNVPPGEYMALSVVDTGTGMTPDVIARAFDPFFTTKPIGQGTGLGLSMIYGFVLQSGGHVRLRSEVGQGTTVAIYLPRHLEVVHRTQQAGGVANLQTVASSAVVLVVEDEPDVRMVVVEVLSELGFTVLEAADGRSGLQILESGTRIDLLLTDVGLPGGMNGRQLADAARQRRPELQVLFVTGYAESVAASNGQMEPGMQVMIKPFSLDALAARVQGIVSVEQPGLI